MPGSSIRTLDSALVCNLTKKCLFLAVEFRRSSQLSRWSRKSKTNEIKDKFSRFLIRFNSLKFYYSAFDILLYGMSTCTMTALAIVIKNLLVIGNIERNLGPADEECFRLCSQNCRGLTDRSKLSKLLRNMFPQNRSNLSNMPSITCLQETHRIDRFVLDHYFKGSAIVDDGERNQRGTCILIPDHYEVCSHTTSGVGRWGIAVVKEKDPRCQKKLVIVNVYGPNCHREAVRFYQDLFESLDEVTQGLVVRNECFETVITGDFNAVLDHLRGASDRIGSRSERDLARLIKEYMVDRNLFESIQEDTRSSFTW